MADNTEDTSIKAPIEKQETTEQAIQNGLSEGIKKTLPKIIHSVNETTTKAFTKTAGFVSESINSGLKDATLSINKGLSNIKDFGSDLFTDVIDAAKDVVSPGGLTTMMTGMPFLGAAVDNTIDKVKDTMSDFKDQLAMSNERYNEEEEDDRSYYANQISDDFDETNNIVSSKLGEVVEATDVTNDLLFNMLNVNKSFNKLYKDGQVHLLKDKREQQLREAEAERERLDALKKEREEIEPEKDEKDEEKESWFSKFFKSIKERSSGLLSGLMLIGKMVAKALVWVTAIVAAFNGLYTFFKDLTDGKTFKEALINGLTDFIHVLTWGLVDKETVNNIVSMFIGPIVDFVTNIGKSLLSIGKGIYNIIAGIFDADLNRIKEGLLSFGAGVEGIFNSIINYFMDILKTIYKVGEGIFKIGEKIGGGIAKWFNKWFDDEEDEKIEQKTKSKDIDIELPRSKYVDDFIERNRLSKDENITKFDKYSSVVNPILENSKQITEIQRPVQTTIINNNTNNMTQMSNNNAIGKTNMIVNSSLRNMDPTFNQCIIGSFVPSM